VRPGVADEGNKHDIKTAHLQWILQAFFWTRTGDLLLAKETVVDPTIDSRLVGRRRREDPLADLT
jgi:hypothetical protein